MAVRAARHTTYHMPPSSMCTLWTSLLNLFIPEVPFPVLLLTLIRSRFQAKPATLLISIDYSFLFAVEELYGTRYQSGSFSWFIVGSGFYCLRSFFPFFHTYFLTVWRGCSSSHTCHGSSCTETGRLVYLILLLYPTWKHSSSSILPDIATSSVLFEICTFRYRHQQ